MTQTHDENKELLARYKNGDESAAGEIIAKNYGLIKSIALRFLGRGQEFEDLLQIGFVGMLKAIRGYDEKFGTVFSTYAVPLVTGEIRRFLRDDGLIKVGRNVKKNAYTLMREREKYISKYGKEPKLSELAKLCDISPEDAVYALDAAKPAVSLQEKISEDSDTELMDLCHAEDDIDALCEKTALAQVLSKLPENERELLVLRYFKGLTQAQTAKILGVTQVKVSRSEKKIINKLRVEFL